jgi:hypothetical protein
MRLGRGHTGRTIEASTDYALARDWSEARWTFTRRWHAGARRFRDALRNVGPLTSGSLAVWRGRADPTRSIASWEDMGPPPTHLLRDQRYSRQGSPALYLANSAKGVCRELASTAPLVAVQQFLLDLSQRHVVDLASSDCENYVHCVFDFAEWREPAGFGFSHAVARIVRDAGFDGMLVPGVRGAPGHTYHNVVVFRSDSWRDWLQPVCTVQHLDTGALP